MPTILHGLPFNLVPPLPVTLSSFHVSPSNFSWRTRYRNRGLPIAWPFGLETSFNLFGMLWYLMFPPQFCPHSNVYAFHSTLSLVSFHYTFGLCVCVYIFQHAFFQNFEFFYSAICVLACSFKFINISEFLNWNKLFFMDGYLELAVTFLRLHNLNPNSNDKGLRLNRSR